MIRVSVVIPTRNRPGQLGACLSALAASFRSDAETIVVSDGADQRLVALVAPFVEPLRLTLLQMEHRGPAAARNRGLEVARGEIVAFTDDDCRPQPGWLAALVGGVCLSPPRAVAGTTRNGLPDNIYADAAELVLRLIARHDRSISGRERLLPSNNIAFPIQTLRSVGGFDERYRTAEDRELCRRWAEAGFMLGRVPGAIVEHDRQLDLKSFVSKFVAYGRGAARFHSSGATPSLHESLRFHFRLPILLLPELRERGLVRSFGVVMLLVLWETANLIGYIAEKAQAPQSLNHQREKA
jgi:glycosyltransferase involved in cell wall biosynthesis